MSGFNDLARWSSPWGPPGRYWPADCEKKHGKKNHRPGYDWSSYMVDIDSAVVTMLVYIGPPTILVLLCWSSPIGSTDSAVVPQATGDASHNVHWRLRNGGHWKPPDPGSQAGLGDISSIVQETHGNVGRYTWVTPSTEYHKIWSLLCQ